MTRRQDLLKQAKRWIEQEKAWDSTVFSSSAARPSSRPSPMPPPEGGTGEGEKQQALAALHEKYKDCVRCPLGKSRIRFVFGIGPATAEVLLIGEGPGYEEDRQGQPFVGKSGQLLDKMLSAIQLSRHTNAYIANIVKCHPMINPNTPEARGNDRPPTPDEVATCSPILLEQIAILKPRFIMTLGSPSTKMILRTSAAITGLRGRWAPFPVDEFYPEIGGAVRLDASAREALRRIRVLPTFHPAALLRNPNLKADAWTDLKLLRDALRNPDN